MRIETLQQPRNEAFRSVRLYVEARQDGGGDTEFAHRVPSGGDPSRDKAEGKPKAASLLVMVGAVRSDAAVIAKLAGGRTSK